jgi:release factor glutamine methyltransferase
MSPDPAVVLALRAAGCVFAEEEAGLLMGAARNEQDFVSMVQQRISGIPLEHILGWAEFCGSRMVVEPGVFVPRRRTEFLVRQAALVAKPGAVVVDLCCGSGAIGAALSDQLGSCQLYGADIDPLAVACAARNIGPRGGQVFQGDLFEPLPPELRGRVDVLLVNAPYVPTGSIAMMPPEARLHEPLTALDGGSDGLDVQRRVVRDSPEWLSPGGTLLIETSDEQASATASLMVDAGLRASVLFDGDFGATVVLGRWP